MKVGDVVKSDIPFLFSLTGYAPVGGLPDRLSLLKK